MMLAKGSKSLQVSLDGLIPKLGLPEVVPTNVAYCKAKQKFKHTAFIELNQTAVIDTVYGDGDYRTWKGLRILGNDGSKVRLPMNDDTIAAFGTIPYSNKKGGTGEHCYALASVLYDVLNRVAIDSLLEPCTAYKVDLAVKQLAHVQPGDLVIYDRGYASYRMMAAVTHTAGEFLIRIPKGRFPIATRMLQGEGPDDVTVPLKASKKFLTDPANQELPTTLTVRFVRVTLTDGTHEVLATSLRDKQTYPTDDFAELYWLRWGIETFYGILKTRLVLENFSGYSPEAIRQDFFAAVFITGIESILTMDAEDYFGTHKAGHPKKVNKAVSFDAIKNRVFELFLSDGPVEEATAALTKLFTMNPTLVRKDRNPPRSIHPDGKTLDWYKRFRKIAV
jgi:hypothetical protein